MKYVRYSVYKDEEFITSYSTFLPDAFVFARSATIGSGGKLYGQKKNGELEHIPLHEEEVGENHD